MFPLSQWIPCKFLVNQLTDCFCWVVNSLYIGGKDDTQSRLSSAQIPSSFTIKLSSLWRNPSKSITTVLLLSIPTKEILKVEKSSYISKTIFPTNDHKNSCCFYTEAHTSNQALDYIFRIRKQLRHVKYRANVKFLRFSSIYLLKNYLCQ